MSLHFIRLVVALLTFGIGLGTSALWNSLRQPVACKMRPRTTELVFGHRPAAVFQAQSETIVSGGVLNGKAKTKTAPVYPAIAKAARASGSVEVEIVVDESGNVASARAVKGHPLLQQAAVRAVEQWKFSPTYLSGRPVKVAGTVFVNFSLE